MPAGNLPPSAQRCPSHNEKSVTLLTRREDEAASAFIVGRAPPGPSGLAMARAQVRRRRIARQEGSSGALLRDDRVPRNAIARSAEAGRSLWAGGVSRGRREAIARPMPPASSCITTARPRRTSSPPRRGGTAAGVANQQRDALQEVAVGVLDNDELSTQALVGPGKRGVPPTRRSSVLGGGFLDAFRPPAGGRS